jgi:ribonucleoside-diphosphate reductase alpha chain
MKKDNSPKQHSTSEGLRISRRFTAEGKNVFDAFEFEKRTTQIKANDGRVYFELKEAEFPKKWSQTASDIVAQKYFRKEGVPQPDGTLGSETSLKQVVHRIVHCWTDWGSRYGYFASEKDAQIFYDEMVFMMLDQKAAPNSPQWFNTGLHSSYGISGPAQGHYFVDPKTQKVTASTSAYERPQPHACFILSVEDDLVNENGIMDLWVREARIFKYGSGVGTNFSNLRSEAEKLSGGGNSSGLISFLKVGDRAAGAIKSGGTTRRAAKMVCLDMDHPEILEFIRWKSEEEVKAKALISAGYSSDYEGEAYRTVSGQNSNNSVRISNGFMESLEKDLDWNCTGRTDGKVVKTYKASYLWDEIAKAAWSCADPGVQFDTTINEWHTCPESGPIRASNPCSEYMFLDNTACNLASLNLVGFLNTETLEFKVEDFRYACRLWTVALEISVLMAQFPSKEIARLSYEYRTLGLGHANIGSMLMISGIPYDSPQATAIAGAITAIMTGEAYATSAEMASFLGAFKGYEKNKTHMLRVIQNHRFAANNMPEACEGLSIAPMGINPQYCPQPLLQAAGDAWDKALELGKKYGYRNAQTTVIAPTGTIALVMDCDTTGAEPDFAPVKAKKLSGGGNLIITNMAIPIALRNLGYNETERAEIQTYVLGHRNFQGAPHINAQTLLDRGLTPAEIARIESSLLGAFHVSMAFQPKILGEASLRRLGFTPELYEQKGFNLLTELGFTWDQIGEANDFLCGFSTLEGAPHLRFEHYPIFDCANPSGKGIRFIHPHGHIRMLAALQAFISGAISKTINLPEEASVADIQECYLLSWKLGLKANALYRNNCKSSQPLTTAEKKKESDSGETKVEVKIPEGFIDGNNQNQVIEAALKLLNATEDTGFKRKLSGVVSRKNLKPKRIGPIFKGTLYGPVVEQSIFIHAGEYEDGTLGEIFIDTSKQGDIMKNLLDAFAIAVSIGLQYGVPLSVFADKFKFTQFEPSGRVDHPYIKSASSILDYIFKVLDYEYNGETKGLQIVPEPGKNRVAEVAKIREALEFYDAYLKQKQNTSEKEQEIDSSPENSTAPSSIDTSEIQNPKAISQVKFAGYGPACTACGSTTIRNGTCFLCTNCGATSGCS